MAVRQFAFPGSCVQRIVVTPSCLPVLSCLDAEDERQVAVAPSCLPVSSCSDAGDERQLAGTEDCTRRVGSEDCTQWAGTVPERIRCRKSQTEVAEPDDMPYIDCAGPFDQEVRMAYQAVEVLVGKTENGAGTRRSWRLEGLAHAPEPELEPEHVPVPVLERPSARPQHH